MENNTCNGPIILIDLEMGQAAMFALLRKGNKTYEERGT
jgi:hypothetical protein